MLFSLWVEVATNSNPHLERLNRFLPLIPSTRILVIQTLEIGVDLHWRNKV